MTNPTLETPEETSAAAEAVALLPVEREAQLMGLANRMQRCVSSAEENLGQMEEELRRGGQELMRQMLEKAAQAKAAAVPPRAAFNSADLPGWSKGPSPAEMMANSLCVAAAVPPVAAASSDVT